MIFHKEILTLFTLIFPFGIIVAQLNSSKLLYINPSGYAISDIPPNYKLIGISKTRCKEFYLIFNDTSNVYYSEVIRSSSIKKYTAKKSPFLKIHGNVMYDYFYQSYLDTPYSGSSLQQHTISTYLDITVKDAYPLRLSFTERFGNANYLRDLTAMNLQFDQAAFIRSVKQKAQALIYQQLNPDSSILQNLKDNFQEKQSEYKEIKKWLTSPSVLQMLIAEREKLLAKKNPESSNQAFDSAGILKNTAQKLSDVAVDETQKTTQDSTTDHIAQLYAQQQARLDSVKKTADSLWAEYSKEKKKWDSTKNAITSAISNLRDLQKWKESLMMLGGADSILPKGYNILSNISKFGIGTSVADYSELTVKNITINGLQLEYTPGLYYAVAAGVINYRFRDYLLPEPEDGKQYLALIRFGKGSPSNHLIFTYYFGKKNLYDYFINDSSGAARNSSFFLMGMALEKKVSITKNINLSAEIAKSTIPYYNRVDQDTKLTQGAFNFSNRSNEAYSIKADAVFPSMHTKLDGYYKHYGENFQSFSLFSTNTRQNAWLIHAEQALIKSQLTINASIRKNDYINPFLNQVYTSNIIFKSIQATLHVKKLPIVSIGYYPTSQQIKSSDNHYSENLFYNLTGSITYYYRLLGLQMNSSILGTRFYNKASDSNFVYYNSQNILLNHNILIRDLTLSGGFSESVTNTCLIYAISGGMQWKVRKWLLIGGTLKYNRQSIADVPQIGYSFNSGFIIPWIGNIQLRIQKAYVPGPDAKLVSDNIGRLTYHRNF